MPRSVSEMVAVARQQVYNKNAAKVRGFTFNRCSRLKAGVADDSYHIAVGRDLQLGQEYYLGGLAAGSGFLSREIAGDNEEEAMTIWQLLHPFPSVKPGHRLLVDGDPVRTLSPRPGMHQVIEEPDELVPTREDREFLLQLGICTSWRK